MELEIKDAIYYLVSFAFDGLYIFVIYFFGFRIGHRAGENEMLRELIDRGWVYRVFYRGKDQDFYDRDGK